MKRWLVLTLGLGLAGWMAYALLTAGTARPPASRPAAGTVAGPAPDRPVSAEPRDRIGEPSREALLRILRDAERADGKESGEGR